MPFRKVWKAMPLDRVNRPQLSLHTKYFTTVLFTGMVPKEQNKTVQWRETVLFSISRQIPIAQRLSVLNLSSDVAIRWS